MSPYRVEWEWDGCCDGAAAFQGSRDQCLAFIRKNWHKARGQLSLALINNSSGRCESYVLKEGA